ncbi:biopolymer transporter Tol [Actinopolymorpha pittospori]
MTPPTDRQDPAQQEKSHHRTLRAGQRSQVWVAGPDLSAPRLLFQTDEILIEAPNWTLGGQHLLVNGDGAAWTLNVHHPEQGLDRIVFDPPISLNNDHVLSPDGEHIYLSAMDTHIYRGPLAGGSVTQLTPNDGKRHFLHGVSPDDRRLAYVQIDDFARPGTLAILNPDHTVTVLDTGPGHLDGPEWSPDGRWIYFNTEAFTTTTPGHAQIARISDQGGPLQRLTTSSTVDWFPHLSPDGRWASYTTFPPGTIGHPADLPVEIRLVSVDDWNQPVQSYALLGGQGSLNVNSWSPDSTRVAYIAYPIET